MLSSFLRSSAHSLAEKNLGWIFPLFIANVLFNIISNASFKASAASLNWRSFLIWQVVGNLTGFITVLTLTGLLRLIPLHVVYPVTIGLAVIGVQVFAARILFHEAITPTQWLGTFVVMAGIMLISRQ